MSLLGAFKALRAQGDCETPEGFNPKVFINDQNNASKSEKPATDVDAARRAVKAIVEVRTPHAFSHFHHGG